MVYGRSLWELYQQQNMSRRQFLKTCFALTGMLGLSPAMLPEVVARAQTQALVPLIWLHGLECTGCSESFLRSRAPSASDVLLKMVSLEYDELLSAGAGSGLERHRDTILDDYAGKYLLVTEGAVPLGDDGYCAVGGRPYADVLQATARQAAAVLAVGSCATWGGIQAAEPNPTQAVAVQRLLPGKQVIQLPGCPPIPEVITAVIMSYTLFGQPPRLDRARRPSQYYGKTVHDSCFRRPFFEAEKFAEKYGDSGFQAGWCLYKLGCRGPTTFNACANIRWWQGLSYPVQSGAPCIGCSADGFWDDDPFSAFQSEEGG
ncbi:MAG: hydrogenase small subunit [Negativicutes bacterium]|nr:hydrogenase small subunit [Negativicutes bacterium]